MLAQRGKSELATCASIASRPDYDDFEAWIDRSIEIYQESAAAQDTAHKMAFELGAASALKRMKKEMRASVAALDKTRRKVKS